MCLHCWPVSLWSGHEHNWQSATGYLPSLPPGVLEKYGRLYVPSRIADNPHLDGEEYRQSLLHLPPVERERLMNGDWSVQERTLIHREWLRYFVEVGGTAGPSDLPMVPGLGSVLIRRDGNVLGAVGVSGGRPEQDLECAQSGLGSIELKDA